MFDYIYGSRIFEHLTANGHLLILLYEGVFVMMALSWLILLASRLIFKECFTNKYWKAAFMTMVTAPTLVILFLCSIDAYAALPLYILIPNEDMTALPRSMDFNIAFFPLFGAFTAVYLIYFCVRLAGMKRNPLSAAENPGGGDAS